MAPKSVTKAATLTRGGEMTYFSFPIEKTEETADGDLIIWGKATDGTLDSDLQIVDPEWSAKALRQWLAEGPALRVQHQTRRDPAGKGLEVEITPDGHYVKSLVVEPVAKELVRKGVLRDYSVGIMNPDIRIADPAFRHLDPTGKAINGVITGKRDDSSRIGELSLCDRGSNHSTSFQLVKAAGDDGHAELSGELDGPEDVLAKAAEPDLIKGTVSFKPTDLAKLLDLRATLEKADAKDEASDGGADAESDGSQDEWSDGDSDDSGDEGKAVTPDAEKRDFTTARRKELASKGHALPDGSYPIETAADLGPAATLARSGHGDADAAKRLIARRAKELGAANPLDAGKTAAGDCKLCSGSGKIRDGEMDCPDCDGKGSRAPKDDDGDKGAGLDLAKAGKRDCTGCGMGHDGDSKDKFCSGCGHKLPEMASKAAEPTVGAGVVGERTEVVPEHREPDGPAIEALEHDAGMPTVPDDEVMKTLRRAKTLGVPVEEARLHDLLCPAYSPDDVTKCHPGTDLAAAVDGGGWQAKALTVATSAPMDQARGAMVLWQHAETIKATPVGDTDDIRWEAFKTFMDAQSGPGTFPKPSELTATRFTRPLITDGREATAPGSAGPNHGPVPSGQTSAAQFGRGPLTADHAADAPQNDGQMDAPVSPPATTGKPGRQFYRNSAKDQARQAMSTMHDHIAQTFPDICPMHAPTGRDPGAVGKVAEPAALTAGLTATPPPGLTEAMADVAKAVAPDAERARLADLVLKGEVSVESARVALGIEAPDIAKGMQLLAPAPFAAELVQGPDIASIVAAELTKAMAPLNATIAKQQELIDSMADQPDPRDAPWRGGAMPSALKALSPAPGGQETQAAARERSQAALQHELLETARTSPNPADREAAYSALFKMGGFPDLTKTAGPSAG